MMYPMPLRLFAQRKNQTSGTMKSMKGMKNGEKDRHANQTMEGDARRLAPLIGTKDAFDLT
jgi:hypothetical protein